MTSDSTSPIRLVDLKAQYARYEVELEAAVKKVFTEAAFIGGRALEIFESKLSAYISKGLQEEESPYHAIGCSSGTDALLLALMTLGVGPGDEVITTPYTFIATGEMIAFVGAKPVFVDVNPETYLLEVSKVEAVLTPRTKAILPVGLFGVPADMEALGQLAKARGVTVIEDAAQSFGANVSGRASGALAPLSCTSFFPAKPLGGAGDGGAIFVADDAQAERIRMLLNHGQSRRYYHDIIGVNARLDALQAAVLTVKLKYLDLEIKARNRIARHYNHELDRTRFTPQTVPSNVYSAYAQYSFTCSSDEAREKLIKRLEANNIGYGIYYPIPLHLQQAFKTLGYKKGDFPVAETLAETMLSIPVQPFLTEAEEARVLEVVHQKT